MADDTTETDGKPLRRKALEPQPHGGALVRDGAPGHRGGGGRPPSAIRAQLRGSFAERVPILERIADGEVTFSIRRRCPNCGHEPEGEQDSVRAALKAAPSAGDRIKALELMARIGLGRDVPTEAVREKLAATVDAIREAVPVELAAPLLKRVAEIWRDP